jgi:hypothetical protein
MAQLNADLSNYEIQERPDPLPPGWYEAVVYNSEIKEGPSGPYINWDYAIVGKPNHVYDIMSLTNDVSKVRLKTLAACCSHPNPNYLADTEELHGKTFMVKLKIEVDESGQYAPKNKATAFKAKNGNGNKSASVAPAPQPQPQQPAQIQKMPWQA